MINVSERRGLSLYGNLADGIVFSIAEYKRGRISEEVKFYFLAIRNFLDRIIKFENVGKNQEKSMKLCNRLSLLQDNSILLDSWINSEVNFPKNDEEYLARLTKYRNCMEEIYNTKKSSNEMAISDIEKIFDKMGDICLQSIHKCSLHDLPKN